MNSSVIDNAITDVPAVWYTVIVKQSTDTVSAVELKITSTFTHNIVSVNGTKNPKFVANIVCESPNLNDTPKSDALTIAGVNTLPRSCDALPYIAGFPPVISCHKLLPAIVPHTMSFTTSLAVGSIGVATAYAKSQSFALFKFVNATPGHTCVIVHGVSLLLFITIIVPPIYTSHS